MLTQLPATVLAVVCASLDLHGITALQATSERLRDCVREDPKIWQRAARNTRGLRLDCTITGDCIRAALPRLAKQFTAMREGVTWDACLANASRWHLCGIVLTTLHSAVQTWRVAVEEIEHCYCCVGSPIRSRGFDLMHHTLTMISTSPDWRAWPHPDERGVHIGSSSSQGQGLEVFLEYYSPPKCFWVDQDSVAVASEYELDVYVISGQDVCKQLCTPREAKGKVSVDPYGAISFRGPRQETLTLERRGGTWHTSQRLREHFVDEELGLAHPLFDIHARLEHGEVDERCGWVTAHSMYLVLNFFGSYEVRKRIGEGAGHAHSFLKSLRQGENHKVRSLTWHPDGMGIGCNDTKEYFVWSCRFDLSSADLVRL